MVSYYTGADPIEIGDLGSKVKVTVTENVCKIDEKNCKKFKSKHFLNQIPLFDWKFDNRHFDTKYMTISHNE